MHYRSRRQIHYFGVHTKWHYLHLGEYIQYIPNSHQLRFFKKFYHKVKSVKSGHFLICGDLNMVDNPNMDSISSSKHQRLAMGSFLHAEELYDAWRCLYGEERDYTFFSSRFRIYSMKDYFLVDKWLLQQASSSFIHDITWSDHALISLSIEENDACSPLFVWRCNNSNILNPDNKSSLAQHPCDYFQNN